MSYGDVVVVPLALGRQTDIEMTLAPAGLSARATSACPHRILQTTVGDQLRLVNCDGMVASQTPIPLTYSEENSCPEAKLLRSTSVNFRRSYHHSRRIMSVTSNERGFHP